MSLNPGALPQASMSAPFQGEIKSYAISTRYPYKLLNQDMIFKEVQKGVYDLTWGSRLIRVIVLSRIGKEKRNSIWQLFSGKDDGFVYGDEHYEWHCPTEKAVLNQLYELYKLEGGIMPYTMEDFTKDFTREHLHLLPPEERLKGLPPSERLKGLRLETVFEQFSPEAIKEYLAKLKS